MKAVFMGTPDFAVPTLQKMVDMGIEITAVVTQPDKAKGRGKKVIYSPVKECALAHDLPVYQPEHYCIQTAAAQDYDSFYSQEIRFRQMLHYPPDRQMMVMLAEGEHDQQTGQAVQKLREIAGEADFEAVEFIGPSRAGIAKAKDLYRYTMYMKHQDIKELMRLRDFLEGYLKWSQQFSNIYFTFDIRES